MADQIKLAVIGCGGMAGAHGDWLKDIPEADVVALCDINRDNMERLWKTKFGGRDGIRLYDSMEQLLQSPPPGLQAVIIVTPHALHFPQAMAALDAGYHVLVEKPMVTSSDHARKLAEKVKETGLLLQVSFQSSYTSEFAYIRNAIQSGAIGELQTITAWSHQGWKPQGGRDTWKWRHDPEMSGGGQMYDTGAHLFNAIAWCLDRPVEEVFCWIDKKDMLVDINAVMTIRWQGGVLGTATISGNNPGWDEGIIIAGDKGRLHTGIHGGRLEHHDKKLGKIKYPSVPYPHYTPDKNFVYCLLGREKPMCPVRYGILHSWLMDALYESARTKAPVKLSAPPLPPAPSIGIGAA
ncbi:MAG TPA: Gfo/Idh/MocA family oxidoreductase [Tepidisphaeraceae bacterium]